MSTYMVPVDGQFIEIVAKAIARNRLYEAATGAMKDTIDVALAENPELNRSFDSVFEKLWDGNSPHDELQKSMYRSDARAAISAINLKILISE